MRAIWFLLLGALVTGCLAPEAVAPETAQDPFEILRPRSDRVPDKLVLAIETSPGQRPMLEGFTVSGPDTVLVLAPFSASGTLVIKNPKSTRPWDPAPEERIEAYFEFRIEGKAVAVTFMPKAMELLPQECKVSWVDWYQR